MRRWLLDRDTRWQGHKMDGEARLKKKRSRLRLGRCTFGKIARVWGVVIRLGGIKGGRGMAWQHRWMDGLIDR